MTPPLYLDLTDYVNANRWRWVLYDAQQAFVADPQVTLDPAQRLCPYEDALPAGKSRQQERSLSPPSTSGPTPPPPHLSHPVGSGGSGRGDCGG